MHKDEIKGKLKEMEGRAQQAWGDLTDEPEHVNEGQTKETEGELEQVVGKVKETLHRAID
jgi:uncharacterized protein YjbJ (UPF0337 family)